MNRRARYLTAARLDQIETQLSHQDRHVVRVVATVHLASGDQLRRTCFGEETTTEIASRGRHARRRLARLVELEVLSRLSRRVGGVRAGSSGFVYALAPAGQRLVAAWNGRASERGRQPHEPAERFVDHRLEVTEVYTRLTEASREGRGKLLQFVAEPNCWRPFAGPYGAVQRLKPDAFVRLMIGRDELLWFAEADRGTVSRAALARQIAAYLAYWNGGHHGDPIMPRVLWLVPDSPRADSVEAIVAEAGAPAGLFVVAPTSQAIDRFTDCHSTSDAGNGDAP